MNFERSKSTGGRGGKELEMRAKGFLKRQDIRDLQNRLQEQDFSSPLKNLNQTIIIESTIETDQELVKKSLSTSKTDLKDLKKFQEILRKQLNNKYSYTTSSVLKKVKLKCEEVEKNVKSIESKSKEFQSMTKKFINSLSNTSHSLLQTPFCESCSKLQNFSIFSQKALKTIETAEIRQTKSNLDLLSSPQKILKDPSQDHRSFIQLHRPGYLDQFEYIENLKQFEISLICKSILDSIITNAESFYLKREKAEICRLKEQVKQDIRDFSIYQSKMIKVQNERNKEVEEKELIIVAKEKQISRQMQELVKDNPNKLIQIRLQELEKKEAKLRDKHLKLLEFKEFLNDKEEELLQKEVFLKARYSSVYKEFDGDGERSSWNDYLVGKGSDVSGAFRFL